jgi:type II secretory pathway pseudopilin PulG
MATPDQPKSKNNKWVLVAIGCLGLSFVGLVVLGILAAIAIPSFMKFTNRAKTAEAQMLVMSIGNAAATHYMNNCAFPPSAAPSSAVPKGGEQLPPNFAGPGWNELALTDTAPKFFSYSTQSNGEKYIVTALADFDEGGPKSTVTVELTGDKTACMAEMGSVKKENELE